MPIVLNVDHTITQILIHNDTFFLGTQSGVVLQYTLPQSGTPYLLHEYITPNTSSGPVLFLHIHQDFLYALLDGNVYQWNIVSKIFHRNFTSPPNVPETLTFITFKDTLVTFHADSFAYAWSIPTGTQLTEPQQLITVPIYSILHSYSFCPDTSQLTDTYIYATKHHVLQLFKRTQKTIKLFDIDPSGSFNPKIFIDNHTLYVQDSTNTIHRKYLLDPSIKKAFYAKKFELIFPYDDYLFICMDQRIKLTNHEGLTIQRFVSHTSTVTAMYASNNILVSASTSGDISVDPINIAEEDTTYYSHVSINTSNVSNSRTVNDCSNISLFALSPYTADDDPIMFYLPNSNNMFSKAICTTHDELISLLNSDKNTATPTNIMAIYSRPRLPDNTGVGSFPLGKIVIKLPVNNVYVTYGSMKRVISEMSTNKIWYAIPLFGGKKRRIGNIKGIYGVSMNHGQTPGFLVYKLFSPNDLHDIHGITCKESHNDWPSFLVNAGINLSSIINVDDQFTNLLINELVRP